MGTYLVLKDFDKEFDYHTQKAPTVIDYEHLVDHPFFTKALTAKQKEVRRAKEPRSYLNTINARTKAARDQLNASLYTAYIDRNEVDDMPICECGKKFGMFKRGAICDSCLTKVESNSSNDLQPLVWIKAPDGIPKLMPTITFRMFRDRLMRGKFDVFRYIIDTSYVPMTNLHLRDTLEKAGIQRGYVNFYRNFDRYMDILLDLLPSGPRGRPDEFRIFIERNRSKIFTNQLPVPNKTLLVVEKAHFGSYMDLSLNDIINALLLMTGIDSELCTLTAKQKENRVVKVMDLISTYYDNIIKLTLSKKKGVLRRNVFGSNAPWSFRTVISSISDPHDLNHVHIPWNVGVVTLRYELINKLMKRINPATGRRWCGVELMRFLDEHTSQYHPLLDELFQELIAESPEGGIPLLANRNPSLLRGLHILILVLRIFLLRPLRMQ